MAMPIFTDAIILILGSGLILAAWDGARQLIAARKFNAEALERIAKLEAASIVHDERIDGLHSKLGVQQAATNQARMRGLR